MNNILILVCAAFALFAQSACAIPGIVRGSEGLYQVTINSTQLYPEQTVQVNVVATQKGAYKKLYSGSRLEVVGIVDYAKPIVGRAVVSFKQQTLTFDAKDDMKRFTFEVTIPDYLGLGDLVPRKIKFCVRDTLPKKWAFASPLKGCTEKFVIFNPQDMSPVAVELRRLEASQAELEREQEALLPLVDEISQAVGVFKTATEHQREITESQEAEALQNVDDELSEIPKDPKVAEAVFRDVLKHDHSQA